MIRRKPRGMTTTFFASNLVLFFFLVAFLILLSILYGVMKNDEKTTKSEAGKSIAELSGDSGDLVDDAISKEEKHPSLLLSCNEEMTIEDAALIAEMKRLMKQHKELSRVVFTIATLGSWEVLLIHLASLSQHAPNTKLRYVLVCGGVETFQKCQMLKQVHCLLDEKLGNTLKG